MAVLGPGTGLARGRLLGAGVTKDSIVIASEGGHATMAATSQREDAIMDLRRQFGHVSAEQVVSGSGLNLYRAVLALDGVDAPAAQCR